MSNPHATKTRELSKLDLELYLDMMQKRIDKYKLEDIINPDDYNKKEIKKLSGMCDEAIARYHNQ